jgi:hypothetical protein
MTARIAKLVDEIYRIAIWHPESKITFNQLLIAGERRPGGDGSAAIGSADPIPVV